MWKKRLKQPCPELSLYLQSDLVYQSRVGLDGCFFMAAVISFLSCFLLGLVPSEVYPSGTTASLLFTHAWKKSYYLLCRGGTTLWKIHLPGFIHALPHTAFPHYLIKSYR